MRVEKTGQIDSGATVNVIPVNLAPNELEKSSCTLKMYNKTNIQPVGKCQIVIRNPEKSLSSTFFIFQYMFKSTKINTFFSPKHFGL